VTKKSLPELICDEGGTEGGIISREQRKELLKQREPFDAYLSSKWTGLQSHTKLTDTDQLYDYLLLFNIG